MKTIIDAVNEFKGDWDNTYYGNIDTNVILVSNGDVGAWSKGMLVADAKNNAPKVFSTVCTKDEFKLEVVGLSWFKGEELFKQYLAADRLPAPIKNEHVQDYAKEKQVDYTLSELGEIDGAFNDGKKYLCTTPPDLGGTFTQGIVYTANGEGLVDNFDNGNKNSWCSTGFTSRFEPIESSQLKPVKQVVKQTPDNYEAHKRNTEILFKITTFLSNNNIGLIGESCVDVVIRELSEKHGIDTRTNKEKAMDAYILQLPPITVNEAKLIKNAFKAGTTFKGEG